MDAHGWWTLATLAVGMAAVVGGILVLRLHAFLALVLGALCVGLMTPSAAVFTSACEKAALEYSWDRVVFRLNAGLPGDRIEWLRRDPATGALEHFADLRIVRREAAAPGGRSGRDAVRIAERVDGSPGASLAGAPLGGDLLVFVADVAAARKLSNQTLGTRMSAAFGTTCGKIGILIAMASIIGMCLLESGAADRIVRSTLGLLGERRAPIAFMSSGFVLGIPVFFDTVFYLMIPLAKALRLRTGHSYLLYVLTVVCGATMAHSLVPPTPGPIFVADALGVDIGLMIVAGCIVGLFSSMAGLFFATWISRRATLELRPSPDMSLDDLKKLAERDVSELPPLGLAVLPIALPVLLIGGYFAFFRPFASSWSPETMRVAAFFGNKSVALIVAAAAALMLLIKYRKRSEPVASSVQSALASGGVILLITAAGGAFGSLIQQTGVASLIRELPTGSPLLLLVLAFLTTTAIRTAQGSATVAMITAAGILSSLADAESLGFHPLYLALAIGCGSKPIAWMNDSGFWVIGKMSGMTEAETLRYVTPMTALMGVSGLLVTLLGAMFFPLV